MNARHIDVRGLAPPEPMVAILRRIATLSPPECLVARLDRDPVFLYPELAEIGWEAQRIASPEGEVRLLLKAAT